MANTKHTLPDLIARRNLLFGKEAAKSNFTDVANAYFEAGRMVDALEFFARAEDTAGIDRVEAHAAETGDAFLLHQIIRLAKRPVGAETWATCAKAAEAAEKVVFAIDAYREAGDSAAVERLGGTVPDAEDGAAESD